MEELIAWEYFGFHPNQLYHEIYAVGYNEFLCAVSALRDALLAEFPEPEQQRDVQEGCDRLLASYSRSLDENWFQKFVQFCSSNVFTVPPQVAVYGGVETPGGELESGACEAADELHHQLMATHYLNCKLQQRLKELDREVERRRGVLGRLREEEGRTAMVVEAQRLEREVRERAGQLQEAQLES